MWQYRAQILRVIDGDTIRVLADTGFTQRTEVDLRLIGCYTPEAAEPGGAHMRRIAEIWAEQWTSGPGASMTWPFLIETAQTKIPEPGQKRTFTRYIGALNRYDGHHPVGPPLNELINEESARHPEWGRGTGGA